MNVRDLIDLLSEYDGNTEVHFAYDYGDHWHTTVAPKVQYASEGSVVYSDYHRMPKVVDDDEDAPAQGKEPASVVILSNRSL